MSDETNSQPEGAFPKPTSPRQLQAVIFAERAGEPFIFYRDGDDQQIIVSMAGRKSFNVGRSEANDLPLPFDESVSALHAVLVNLADEWTVEDDGLSRNGTFLNGLRLKGRQRLRDGDWLRFGHTAVAFRSPSHGSATRTSAGTDAPTVTLTEGQKRVLLELCRPQVADGQLASATNQQIADRLVISVETVKSHLHELFGRFDLDAAPSREKRMLLVDRAVQLGALSERDYDD
jgi:pSer/pThr/pTyr-binding forkhead associated (FHA) protein